MIRFTLRDKKPDEDKVYTIDWAPFIGTDLLTGVPTATTEEGTITVDTFSIVSPANTQLDFFVRGGALGEVARALIHVTTQGNQHLDAEIILGVR